MQAQVLAAFKSDIAAMMRDMIKSSLNEFSQSQSDPEGKEALHEIKNPLEIIESPLGI